VSSSWTANSWRRKHR